MDNPSPYQGFLLLHFFYYFKIIVYTVMAYNEKLRDRIREALAHLPKVEEKKMFRGITFMVNNKMCVSVSGEEMMCRFDPALQETAAEKRGFRPMIMKGREFKGYGYISEEGIKSKKEFDYWVGISLDFNKMAKSSKKKKKK
jgi:TfoX/Sxy family transcriptional regulator of competence genes